MKKLFGVQLKKTGRLDETGPTRSQSTSVVGAKKEEPARASGAEAPPAVNVAASPASK